MANNEVYRVASYSGREDFASLSKYLDGELLSISRVLERFGSSTGGLGGATLANPSGLIGMTAVNGVALTGLRSDGMHAINPAIAPDWTGQHDWMNGASNVLRIEPSALDANILQSPQIQHRLYLGGRV
jgi:hypothetical protein